MKKQLNLLGKDLQENREDSQYTCIKCGLTWSWSYPHSQLCNLCYYASHKEFCNKKQTKLDVI